MNWAQSFDFIKHSYTIDTVSSSQKSLIKELEKIASKENLHLAFESHLLLNKYCKLDVDKLPFKDALQLIFYETDLEYFLTDNKQLLIRKKLEDNLEKVKLTGQIKSVNNKEDIAFASISLLGSSIGSYADSLGKFDLVIPSDYIKGKDTIVIHRIGYKDKKIELKEFINNSIIEMNVKTRVLPLLIVIPAINRLDFTNTSFGYTLDNHESNIPLFVSSDILRKVQFLPSVYANKDNSAKLNIRGSKSFETLVLLDGLRIYNPTHFYNVFSSINNDYIKEVKFYKNGVPPNIRSMTGGVVEVSSHSGLSNKTKGEIVADLMYLSTSIRVPISQNFRINLAVRKSVFENTKQSFFGDIISSNNPILQGDRLFNSRGNKDSPGFNFYDINTKCTYEISDRQNIQFNLYKSSDSYVDKFKTIINKNLNSKSIINFRYDDRSSWENSGIGLKYNIKWKNIKSNISISSVQFTEDNTLDISILQKKQDSIKVNSILDYRFSTIEDFVFKVDNEVILNNNGLFYFGLDITNYNVLSMIEIKNSSVLNFSNLFNSYSGYGSFKQRIKKVNIELFIKSSFYNGTTTNYIDPGLKISYDMSGEFSFYSSFNKQHQYLRQFEYETAQSKTTSFWALANSNTPILSSNNFSIGSKVEFDNSKIIIEVYYKTQDGRSILLRPKPSGIDFSNSNKKDFKVFYGDSYNTGIDILWIYKFKDYSSQISYTYSIFNQRFKRIFKNRYHPSSDDTRHQLKWINDYSSGKWYFSMNFVYSSGTPYFDFSDLNKESNRSNIIFEDHIKYLPDYFRSDISINYSFYLFKKKTKLYITVFNITDRINVANRQIIYSDRESTSQKAPNLIQSQSNLLSRTFNLGFKLSL